MRPLSRDTHPETEKRLVQGLRRMTGPERLARVCALRESVLSLARVRILEQYGELPERDIRLRLAALWLDRDTMIRAFGWDPRERGY